MSKTTAASVTGSQRVAAAERRPAASRRRVRPEDGRRHNLGLVLQNLYDSPGLSRADLSRRTGLTRVTISDLVTDLMGDGLVAEAGLVDEARPGKPGTKLNLVEQSRDILALDLSDEAVVSGAVVSLTGQIRHRIDYPLDGATGERATAAVTALGEALVAASDRPIVGVGVGTPGLVGPDGAVRAAHNLDWHRLPLRQLLADALGQAVEVANDANLAAIAEDRFGDGPEDLIRVQISRGVGAGLLIGGAPLVGSSSAAGEIGHVVIDPDGQPCRCGKAGCLETWVAAPALRRRIAAAEAERDAILAEAGRALGLALAPVVGLLDLTEVIVGGPADLITGSFLEASQTIIHDRTRIDARRPVVLRASALGPDAVILGAAALVLRRRLGIH